MEQDMTRRDFERAAKMGAQVNADQQLKYVEKIKKETMLRAEEIRRERELAKQAKEQAQQEEIPVSKRTRRLQELEAQKINQNQEDTTAPNDEENIKEEKEDFIIKEVSGLKKSHITPMPLFKPGVKKVKVEEVPSYFLSYPAGAEIYVIPYTADDIDELSNSKLTLKYIVSKCLEGVYCNFNKDDITFYDAIYLSFFRRCLTFDQSIITVTSACPYCDKYSTREVDVTKEIEFEDSKIPKLPINVDFSWGTLSFSYLTYGNFMKISSTLESEELAYQCINEIEVNKDKEETAIDRLRELFGSATGTDLLLLKEIKKLTYHGIKPINTLCQNPDCGKTYETMINEWDSIILPFRRSKDDIRSKVSFG